MSRRRCSGCLAAAGGQPAHPAREAFALLPSAQRRPAAEDDALAAVESHASGSIGDDALEPR